MTPVLLDSNFMHRSLVDFVGISMPNTKSERPSIDIKMKLFPPIEVGIGTCILVPTVGGFEMLFGADGAFIFLFDMLCIGL